MYTANPAFSGGLGKLVNAFAGPQAIAQQSLAEQRRAAMASYEQEAALNLAKQRQVEQQLTGAQGVADFFRNGGTDVNAGYANAALAGANYLTAAPGAVLGFRGDQPGANPADLAAAFVGAGHPFQGSVQGQTADLNNQMARTQAEIAGRAPAVAAQAAADRARVPLLAAQTIDAQRAGDLKARQLTRAFTGESMPAQDSSLLLEGDPASPAYGLAFAREFGTPTHYASNPDGSVTPVYIPVPAGIRLPVTPTAAAPMAAAPAAPPGPPMAFPAGPVGPADPAAAAYEQAAPLAPQPAVGGLRVGPAIGSGGKSSLTEAQGIAGSRAAEMQGANDELSRLAAAGYAQPTAVQEAIMTSLRNPSTSFVGSLLDTGMRGALPEQAQRFLTASQQFLDPFGRMASGAAILPTEWQSFKMQTIPMPGDAPSTIAYKQQVRSIAEAALQRAAGQPGMTDAQRWAEVQAAVHQAPPPPAAGQNGLLGGPPPAASAAPAASGPVNPATIRTMTIQQLGGLDLDKLDDQSLMAASARLKELRGGR